MAPANPKDRVLEILARKTGLNPAQINFDAVVKGRLGRLS
jgi:hypothetical protein